MKVVARPIEMVACFSKGGVPQPVRFRINTDDEENKVVKIDRVIQKDVEKLAGNHMIVYRCQGCINDAVREFEVKYELGTCKWILFKI